MADLAEPLRRSVAPHDRTHSENRAQSGWGVLPGQMHTRQTRGWGVLLGLLLASLLTQPAGEYSSANLLQPAGEYSSANLLLLLTQPAGEYSSANLLLLLTRLGSTPRPICYYYLLSRLGSTPRPICYYYLLSRLGSTPRLGTQTNDPDAHEYSTTTTITTTGHSKCSYKSFLCQGKLRL